MRSEIRRREVVVGLGTMPLTACAGFENAREIIQVNLADKPLPAPPQAGDPDAGLSLQTAFDAVRRMTVPVHIDRAGPYQFVVDTGANHSVLASERAAALRIPSAGRATVHGIAGVDPAETVVVNRLTIGGLYSRKVRMPLLSRQHLGAEGLLGVNVLARRRVKLDFRNNQFAIAPSDRAPSLDPRARATRMRDGGGDPRLIVVPARQRFGQLTIVDAEVDGVPVTAFLDSGAETTVGNRVLRDEILARAPWLTSQLVSVQLISATGQSVAGELTPVPPLRLGGLRLANLSCVFADLHTFRIWDLLDRPAILVGVDVMRHFDSIELDFGRSLVAFRTSNQPTPIAPPPEA